jgi:hypothetical protein
MQKVKTAKIMFYFTVLLLFSKPFYGFSVFSRIHPPYQSNILIKVFSKCRLEFSEGSDNDINAIFKKLANPVLLFSCFLAVLFPSFFKKGNAITDSFLNELQLSLIPVQPPYLRNGNLLIRSSLINHPWLQPRG